MNAKGDDHTMKASEFLEQIEYLEEKIAHKKEKCRDWKEIAKGTTTQVGKERVQSSGSNDRMADAMAEAVTLEKEIAIMEDTIKEILGTIEKVRTKEAKFLYQHYVEYMSLDEIRWKEGMSYSWATTMKSRALKSVQRILDGKDKRR